MQRKFFALISMSFCLVFGPAHAADLQNPDFSSGLEHWAVSESGGSSEPGTVTAVDGQVSFVEGGSFLMRMSQSFEVPEGLLSISIPVSLNPGFDTSADFHPDAFEISLVDGNKSSVVPVWKQLTASFFNVQENGNSHLASGVTFEEGVVTVDTSGLEEGATIELVFALVGADSDQNSGITIGPIAVGITNKPPVAVAGDDQVLECDGDNDATLDGSASTDPEGLPLTYSWKNSEDEELGTEATLTVSLSFGAGTFTLTVTDSEGVQDNAQVTVTVQDTTPPLIEIPPVDTIISADGSCTGLLPDLASTVDATDACAEDDALVVVQDLAAGDPLSLGAPTVVTVTVSDPSGNSVQATANVSLVDDTPPLIAEPLDDQEVVADETCAGTVPQLVVDASDNCTAVEALVFSQEPTVGQDLVLDESITVTLTVTDESEQTASEETEVLLVDKTAPTISVPDDPIVVSAKEGCVGTLPELREQVTLADNCTESDQMTLDQTPVAGTNLELGTETSVELSTSDEIGNTGEASTVVRMEDPDSNCLEPPEPQPEPDPELTPEPDPELTPEPDPELTPDPELKAEPPPDLSSGCGCRVSGRAPAQKPWTASSIFLVFGLVLCLRFRNREHASN